MLVAQFWRRRMRFLASFQKTLNTPPPRLNHASAEEHAGDIRVEGDRGMLAQQLLYRPVGRQLTGIPDQQLIGVDADLNRRAAGLVLMHHRVQNRFPQCGHVCLPNGERAYRDHVSGKFWLQWGQVMWNAA